MIMLLQPQKTSYRPYKEVRAEIEKKLAPDLEKRRQALDQWLDDITGEAEIIR
jgi:hypothetical protein